MFNNIKLTRSLVGTRQKRRPFTKIERRETIAAYASFEVGMLWAFIEWHVAPKNGSKKIPVFNFDSNQQTALQAFSKELHAQKFTAKKAITKLYTFLDSLYFPLNTSQVFHNIFHSPVVSFLACRFLNADGAYASIHIIPTIISKLQYPYSSPYHPPDREHPPSITSSPSPDPEHFFLF